MVVTATEFKTNLGKYLDAVGAEDIYITRNGKTVARMVNPNISAVDTLSGMLDGTLPEDYDRGDLREDRIRAYESDD